MSATVKKTKKNKKSLNWCHSHFHLHPDYTPLPRLPHEKQERQIILLACSGTSNSTKCSFQTLLIKNVSVLWKIPICSKMDNKCPFSNSLLFSANHWMAVRHFVSHFANSTDNGSYLWPEKLFSINYCVSHKAVPSFLLYPHPTKRQQ